MDWKSSLVSHKSVLLFKQCRTLPETVMLFYNHTYLYHGFIFWGISLLVRNWDQNWAFHCSWMPLQTLINKGLMCSSLVLCVSPCYYASPARLCPTLPPPPQHLCFIFQGHLFQIYQEAFTILTGYFYWSFQIPSKSFQACVQLFQEQ